MKLIIKPIKQNIKINSFIHAQWILSQKFCGGLGLRPIPYACMAASHSVTWILSDRKLEMVKPIKQNIPCPVVSLQMPNG